jgi:hypothetical protein
MSMLAFRCALMLLVGLLGGALSATAAAAQIYVMESTVPAIRVGSALDLSAAVSIPAGSHIRAVLPSGKTQTIKGPYEGTVADLAKGQPVNEGVLVSLKNLLRTGGATQNTAGATRSITRPADKPSRAAFSWSAIPVANGTVCVEKGAKLALIRPASPNAERATIVDPAGNNQAALQWEPGSDTAAWPPTLTLRNDGTYDVLSAGREPRRITLRVLDQLPSEDNLLIELNRLGCSSQFEAWVRGKLAVGN